MAKENLHHLAPGHRTYLASLLHIPGGIFSPSHPKCATFSISLFSQFTQLAGPPVPGDGRYSHNAGATFVTHGQLLRIANRCGHFGDWSLNTSESRGLVGIPYSEANTRVGQEERHRRIA